MGDDVIHEGPDLLDMLDQLADTNTPGLAVEQIVSQSSGHIVLWTERPVRKGPGPNRDYVAFLDMGPVLQLYAGQSVDIRADEARTLATALTAWADRQETPS